jgi:hypothetical protein
MIAQLNAPSSPKTNDKETRPKLRRFKPRAKCSQDIGLA